MFEPLQLTIKLVADDGETSARYGVSTIPHTVVIGRDGTVHAVLRGTAGDLERAALTALGVIRK
jgi:hypothetical protein